MAVFAATVLGGAFIILDLERSEAAPGVAGDTMEVVKPSLRASSCSQITCCGECGNPPPHPLHFWYSGESIYKHVIQKPEVQGGCWKGTFPAESWEFWCQGFKKKRNPRRAHHQSCLSEAVLSEAGPRPPAREAPLLYCCVTFKNHLTSLSFSGKTAPLRSIQQSLCEE